MTTNKALRRILAWLFTTLAVASLVAGVIMVGWIWVSPNEGPLWSTNGEEEYVSLLRTFTLVVFGLLATAATRTFGTIARCFWRSNEKEVNYHAGGK